MARISTPILHHPAVQAFWLRVRVMVVGLVMDFWRDAPYRPPQWVKSLFKKDGQAGAAKPKTAPASSPKTREEPEFYAAEEEEKKKEAVKKEPVPWSADRVQILETLWGAGSSLPGDGEYIDMLTSPLGINDEMSILDLGAGTGDLARRVVGEYNCYVTGMEMDQSLATRGMVMSIADGKGKKAPIAFYDPAAFTATRKYDCILAREVFYRVIGKEKFFKAIDSSLKSGGGQIVFTDFVMDPALRDKPEIKSWLSREKTVATQTQLELIKTWKGMGYDLRIAEDQTHLYKGYIIKGMAEMALFLRDHAPDRETKALLVREIDFWSRRLAALSHGLKYYRFYGIKY